MTLSFQFWAIKRYESVILKNKVRKTYFADKVIIQFCLSTLSDIHETAENATLCIQAMVRLETWVINGT